MIKQVGSCDLRAGGAALVRDWRPTSSSRGGGGRSRSRRSALSRMRRGRAASDRTPPRGGRGCLRDIERAHSIHPDRPRPSLPRRILGWRPARRRGRFERSPARRPSGAASPRPGRCSPRARALVDELGLRFNLVLFALTSGEIETLAGEPVAAERRAAPAGPDEEALRFTEEVEATAEPGIPEQSSRQVWSSDPVSNREGTVHTASVIASGGKGYCSLIASSPRAQARPASTAFRGRLSFRVPLLEVWEYMLGAVRGPEHQ